MANCKIQVLLVDDSVATRQLLTAWLEEDGYEIRTASSAEEAMEAIVGFPPHIVIADWVMREMTGVDLCKWIRQQSMPHYIYCLVLTSNGGAERTVTALEAGADDFVRKPIERVELLARVRSGVRIVELEQRMSHVARFDTLTGLMSRRALFEQMEREWARSRRHHIPLSVAMLDIDYFKRINDTYGHATGDQVLRNVAEFIQESCRDSDLVGRYGGEEFCIILPETDENSAILWAERLRNRVAEAGDLLDGIPLKLTVSIGIAERSSDSVIPDQTVDLADQALLVAKRSGRNRVVGYRSLTDDASLPGEKATPNSAFQRLSAKEVMTTVAEGIDQNESVEEAAKYFLRFRLHSAPVVDERGKMVGVITERDLMSVLLWPNWWTTKIFEIMKRNVVCYEENTPITVIYDFLCRVAIRAVVVVADGRPTGIVSRGILIRWFMNRLVTTRLAKHGDAAEEVVATRHRGEVPREMNLARTADDGHFAILSLLRDELDELEAGFPIVDGETDFIDKGVVKMEARLQELLDAIHSREATAGNS